MSTSRNIYVGSSWRNPWQPVVVRELQQDHQVYDFRHPGPDDNGFHWSEISKDWQKWTTPQYIQALDHPIASRGFKSDFDAMQWADTCVLVLPSGRSAHIEAGYFVGAKKTLIVLLQSDAPIEPELMYKMADLVTDDLEAVVSFLKKPIPQLSHRHSGGE